MIDAGSFQVCTLRRGRLICSPFDASAETDLYATGATAIALTGDQLCAITRSGAVECAGLATSGEVFPPPYLSREPVRDVAGARELFLGSNVGCARGDEGEVWCWRPGHRNGGYLWSPPEPAGLRPVVTGDGDAHLCAATVDRRVWCWGAYPELAPADVGVNDAVEAAVGVNFACARHGDGTVSCWGENDRGQLGRES